MWRRSVLALGLALGCAPGTGSVDVAPVADAEADADADADADTDTDTDTDTSAPLARLDVACAPTDNALRFSCTVDVDPPLPVTLTYARVDGLSVARTVSGDVAASQHVLPLVFLSPQQDYEVEVHAAGAPDDPVTTRFTAGLPPEIVWSRLQVSGRSSVDMIGTHLPCDDAAIAVVYDTNTGDLLWYQMLDADGLFGPNDMVSFTEDHTVLGESLGDVVEFDTLGHELLRLEDLDASFGINVGGIFGNFHHDITKRDGVYYVLYQERFSGGLNPDVLDNLVLFDASGTELARWRALDHLPLPADWGGDYTHTNTIFVDAAGDIHLSWLGQDTIAKIAGDWTSPTFGAPIWYLRGSPKGEIGSSFDIDWSQVGGADTFEEPHSAFLRDDGAIQLLDNAHGRGLVVTLDEVAGTAVVVASHATGESSCGPQGTARTTASGNAVVGCSGSTVREYDPAGTQVWDAEVDCVASGWFVQGSNRWYPLDGW